MDCHKNLWNGQILKGIMSKFYIKGKRKKKILLYETCRSTESGISHNVLSYFQQVSNSFLIQIDSTIEG